MQQSVVSQSIIGNQIVEPVYSKHGTMLIKKGTVINNEVLSKLLSHNVDVVYVLNALRAGADAKGLIPEKHMTKSVSTIKKVFDEVMNQERMGVKAVIPHEDIQAVEEILELLIKSIEQADEVLYSVVDLIHTDEYTYKHNVNVAILTILTAKAMKYADEDVKHIALGALLHDIGKMRVRQELITKPSSLSEDERKEVERHAEFGYEIIESIKEIPYLTKQIILLHHEKLDGTGYPLGLKGIEIPDYVRIVTVCDMYDAMTTNRVYRAKMPIYKALEILMFESVYKIDAKIYRVLTSTICIFPPGSGVVLSDERIGIVSSYRNSNPSRPRVRVLNITGETNHLDVEEVNLEAQRTLFIHDTWDVDLFSKISSNKSSII